MLFKRQHTLVSENPIQVVTSNLTSPNEAIRVTKLTECNLHGIVKTFGSNFQIISNIKLAEGSENQTIISIENRFPFSDYIFLFVSNFTVWAIAIHELIDGTSIVGFYVALMIIFPFVPYLIGRSAFNHHDNRALGFYKSLLHNKNDANQWV